MVTAVRKFFEKYISQSPGTAGAISDHSLRVSTAALLVEIMRADAEVTERERDVVMKTVAARFNLSPEESEALLRLAEEKIVNATGYYEFTSLINKGFSYEQKVHVMEGLWEVAFADRCLDKHEEHAVRKIADLIYVEHKDFIDAKLRVKKRLGLLTDPFFRE